MSDIVERLRSHPTQMTTFRPLLDEAAGEIERLREAINGVITPALLGLINDGDDEPAAMPDDAPVDITGNGFRCQITAGDIRKAEAAKAAS